MRVRIKVCGITSRDDAMAAIDSGIDSIGLVFYPPSPRNVTLSQAESICSSLPPFINITALFVDPSAELVTSLLRSVPIDTLQFHGEEEASFIASFDKPYYKAIHLHTAEDWSRAEKQYGAANALLADTPYGVLPGGTGTTFDWNIIPDKRSKPLILAGGLTPDNIAEAIARTQPYAIDVSSSVEESPGKKNRQKIQAVVTAANNSNCC